MTKNFYGMKRALKLYFFKAVVVILEKLLSAMQQGE
jgi:hypothetical protein